MRTVVVFLLATAGLGAAAAEFDHSPWNALLSRHVNRIGEVDYAALKANRQSLDAYIAALAAASPDSRKELFPNRAAELAYWLNSYNALTAKGVVDNYPTRRVRDLGAIYGFFRRNDYTLGGVAMSLRHLENEIIRKRYQDPRIHFAIVCASISCPLLARQAFTAVNLEEQLDRLTRVSLAENRNVAIDTKTGTLTLTALFKWYAADYGPALAFIRRYSTPERVRLLDQLGPNPRVRFFDYDWSINEPGSRAKAKLGFERELAESH